MSSDIHKSDAEIMAELRAAVKDSKRISTYMGRGTIFPSTHGGYTTLDVLPHLIGLPLNDLVFAWLPAVNPVSVRVSYGEVTTDSRPGRVTILIDKNKIVTSITQEVMVALSSGSNINAVTREARKEAGLEPNY